MSWAIQEGLFAAASLPVGGAGAEDLSLCFEAAGRWCAAQRLKELASERRRFGYRRLPDADRQGVKLNHKKLYRLYREERLTVRKRGGRKRALGTRAPMAIPQAEPTLVARLRV